MPTCTKCASGDARVSCPTHGALCRNCAPVQYPAGRRRCPTCSAFADPLGAAKAPTPRLEQSPREHAERVVADHTNRPAAEPQPVPSIMPALDLRALGVSGGPLYDAIQRVAESDDKLRRMRNPE